MNNRFFKEIIKILYISVLLTLAPFESYSAINDASSSDVEKPNKALNLISVQAAKEDLQQLYSTLQEAHHNLYARRSKKDYDKYFSKLLSSIDAPLTAVEAVKLLQSFAAYGNIAHANLSAPFELFQAHRQAGGKYFSLFITIDKGRVYLTDTADAEGKLLAGTELLSINKKPIAKWLKVLARYVSADNEYLLHAQMEQRFPILLWLELGDVASINVSAKTTRGERINLVLPAMLREEMLAIRLQFPTAALETDFDARAFTILDKGIAYLRPGPFYNMEAASTDAGVSYEDSKYREFIDNAFGKILESKASDLIIDLRNNPGGDNSFSDPMIAWFADKPFHFTSRFLLKASTATKEQYQLLKSQGVSEEGILGDLMRAEARYENGEIYPFEIPIVQPREQDRFTGKVYILQNRHSFSNATSVASLVQDYQFGKIMGEETADLATTYGSSVYFKLKNSGFNVAYPKSYIVRINGDEKPRGVVPDIKLPTQPLNNSQDVVLIKAIEKIIKLRK